MNNAVFYYWKRASGYLLCLLLLLACTEPEGSPAPPPEAARIKLHNDSLIHAIADQLQTGDLILRTGTDFSSDQVKQLCTQNKTYSHAGIIERDADSVFVYHIEPDYEYQTDKLRREPLARFLDPANNYGFGLARYDLSAAEIDSLLAYLQQQFQRKIPFDMAFQLSTDDSLYCSELISKGLATATQNRIRIQTDKLTDKSKYRLIKHYFKLEEKDFAGRELVMVDRLFLNPHCRILLQVLFSGHYKNE